MLVTDRFGAIPDAVGEGRKIINNVQRVAKLFVTKSVFAAFVIATFGLWTAEFPLLPRHLSLAATFTVGVPGFVLALGPGGRTTEQGSFLRRVLRFALPAGAVLGAATLTAYLAVANGPGDDQLEGRTAAVTVFVFVGLYLLLVLEAERMQASRRYAAEVVALAACLGGGFLAMLGSQSLRELLRPGGAGPVVGGRDRGRVRGGRLAAGTAGAVSLQVQHGARPGGRGRAQHVVGDHEVGGAVAEVLAHHQSARARLPDGRLRSSRPDRGSRGRRRRRGSAAAARRRRRRARACAARSAPTEVP